MIDPLDLRPGLSRDSMHNVRRGHAHDPVSPDLPLAIAVPTTLERVMLDGLTIHVHPIEIDPATWLADLRARNVSLWFDDAKPTDEGWTVAASGAGERFVGWLRPLGAIAIECIAAVSDDARTERLRKTCFETQPVTGASGEPELYIPFAFGAERGINLWVKVPGEPEQLMSIESAATAPELLREPALFRQIGSSVVEAMTLSDGWAIMVVDKFQPGRYAGTSRRMLGGTDVVCSVDDGGGGEPKRACVQPEISRQASSSSRISTPPSRTAARRSLLSSACDATTSSAPAMLSNRRTSAARSISGSAAAARKSSSASRVTASA